MQKLIYLCRYKLFQLFFIACLGLCSAGNAELVQQPLFKELSDAKLSKAGKVVERIEHDMGAAALPLFKAMLAGQLYFDRSDNSVLYQALKREDGSFDVVDIASGEAQGNKSKKAIKKIRVNNKLRKQLRMAIARINLKAQDDGDRLNAVKSLLGTVDKDVLPILQDSLATETNGSVVKAIELNLALYDFENGDEAQQLKALETLKNSVEPAVRNEIIAVAESDIENAKLKHAVEVALQKIDAKLTWYQRLEQLFFGLSMGSVFLLAAMGLAITFGVMGVINMAHGEMIMLGAYTTYVVQLVMVNTIGYSLWVAIPAAFIVAGSVGILIERLVIRHLKGRPLETLLATFGISLILQQAVRSIFSPLNRQVSSPEWMSGSWEINAALSLTYNRLYILLFALLVFFAVQLILNKTSLGLNVRAVSQNRAMAKSMGIKTDWVDAMTFGLGSGIAGIAGVALSQLTNVGPNLGQGYIIDSFMVVVFGGVGNLLGTLVAGFTLGVTNKFLEPLTGAMMANILILVFIILFIQKRPQGLFPQKGRAAND